MKKGYVYAMMAAVAAMTVSGCSSSSSCTGFLQQRKAKLKQQLLQKAAPTAADTSDVRQRWIPLNSVW